MSYCEAVILGVVITGLTNPKAFTACVIVVDVHCLIYNVAALDVIHMDVYYLCDVNIFEFVLLHMFKTV